MRHEAKVEAYYALHQKVLLVLVSRPGDELAVYTVPVAGDRHFTEANMEAVVRDGCKLPLQVAEVIAPTVFGRTFGELRDDGYELVR